MTRAVPVTLLGGFLFGFCLQATAGEVKLIASNYSDRYHVSTCKVAQKIPLKESLFFQSPEDAIAAGLRPCKKCNPPASSHPSSD